jgi:uncharacterized protein HemX
MRNRCGYRCSRWSSGWWRIIGATVTRLGAGAAIGGALGLGGGALIGEYMQGQEPQQYQANQQQIQQSQRTIDRNNQQIQRSRQTEY